MNTCVVDARGTTFLFRRNRDLVNIDVHQNIGIQLDLSVTGLSLMQMLQHICDFLVTINYTHCRYNIMPPRFDSITPDWPMTCEVGDQCCGFLLPESCVTPIYGTILSNVVSSTSAAIVYFSGAWTLIPSLELCGPITSSFKSSLPAGMRSMGSGGKLTAEMPI